MGKHYTAGPLQKRCNQANFDKMRLEGAVSTIRNLQAHYGVLWVNTDFLKANLTMQIEDNYQADKTDILKERERGWNKQ